MSSMLGNKIRLSVFGQSHGAGIGVVVDGLPAGEPIDEAALQAFLERRAPGRSATSTARREGDRVKILSGLWNGKTCGAPLCAVIENENTRSADYAELLDLPRPGHADYPALVRYNGANDPRGGGHFSGRLTAPLCIAGGIALQCLARRGVSVGAQIASIAGIADEPMPLSPEAFAAVAQKPVPVWNDAAGDRMNDAILTAKADGDSVGGTIRCAILGVPVGVGDPMFDGWENRLAAALFGIPAVKGLEFGDGFAMADRRGSACNDPYRMENGRITCESNHNGGILGGISNGMPITFTLAVKPTPSIAAEQQTVRLSTGETTRFSVHGRHDPCIVPRAVPVVEAVAAFVALDMLL